MICRDRLYRYTVYTSDMWPFRQGASLDRLSEDFAENVFFVMFLTPFFLFYTHTGIGYVGGLAINSRKKSSRTSMLLLWFIKNLLFQELKGDCE